MVLYGACLDKSGAQDSIGFQHGSDTELVTCPVPGLLLRNLNQVTPMRTGSRKVVT